MECEQVWVQFNLYTAGLPAMDTAVERVVRPSVAECARECMVSGWFFIRYLDETGPHLRLRYRVLATQMEQAIGLIEEFLVDRLPALHHAPAIETRRLIPVKGLTRESPWAEEPRWELALYDPEITKYGGPSGMVFAEEIFEISSQLAVDAIALLVRNDLDRFELALQIMDREITQFTLNREDRDKFLLDYLSYWSGDSYRPESPFSPKLRETAARKRKLSKRILEGPIHAALQADLDRYVKAMGHVFLQVEPSGPIISSARELGFHFIHMMNNRLGVFPVEEAYLAALLLAAGTEGEDVAIV